MFLTLECESVPFSCSSSVYSEIPFAISHHKHQTMTPCFPGLCVISSICTYACPLSCDPVPSHPFCFSLIKFLSHHLASLELRCQNCSNAIVFHSVIVHYWLQIFTVESSNSHYNSLLTPNFPTIDPQLKMQWKRSMCQV